MYVCGNCSYTVYFLVVNVNIIYLGLLSACPSPEWHLPASLSCGNIDQNVVNVASR